MYAILLFISSGVKEMLRFFQGAVLIRATAEGGLVVVVVFVVVMAVLLWCWFAAKIRFLLRYLLDI